LRQVREADFGPAQVGATWRLRRRCNTVSSTQVSL